MNFKNIYNIFVILKEYLNEDDYNCTLKEVVQKYGLDLDALGIDFYLIKQLYPFYNAEEKLKNKEIDMQKRNILLKLYTRKIELLCKIERIIFYYNQNPNRHKNNELRNYRQLLDIVNNELSFYNCSETELLINYKEDFCSSNLVLCAKKNPTL